MPKIYVLTKIFYINIYLTNCILSKNYCLLSLSLQIGMSTRTLSWSQSKRAVPASPSKNFPQDRTFYGAGQEKVERVGIFSERVIVIKLWGKRDLLSLFPALVGKSPRERLGCTLPLLPQHNRCCIFWAPHSKRNTLKLYCPILFIFWFVCLFVCCDARCELVKAA